MRLGMFPLGTVLFPGVLLPLHVFEPRYRALLRDCTSGSRRFGIVLIERGHEVGGGDARFGVGTVAEIVEAVEVADGRWGVGVVGRERLRVQSWVAEEPYPLADVELLPDRSLQSPELVTVVERLVRRALALKAELGDRVAPFTVSLDGDPLVALHQMASVAPIATLDRQALLEIDDPDARARKLDELVTEELGVLAQRVSGL